MANTVLKGVTWDHTRGFLPMVATAQRFHELHPEVEVVWEKRSLQQFADQSLHELGKRYDLLVIDHPFVGEASRDGVLMPLDDVLPRDYLADQKESSVGSSHESYYYDDRQWALAIDAATPAASWRADRLELLGEKVPSTWSDVLRLARSGHVAVPAIPVDSLMNIYMLCLAHGEEPFLGKEEFVSTDVGIAAFESQRELIAAVSPKCLNLNPIGIYEWMTKTDEVAYCPAAYIYSNYARTGYARQPICFGPLAEFKFGQRMRSTLGGTGLAITATCSNPGIAARYARFVADSRTQQTIYTESGGQPGHRAAWLSDANNLCTDGFFTKTLKTVDEAWIRPRYPGYLDFQDAAGAVVFDCQTNGISAYEAVGKLNAIYRKSFNH